MNGCGIVTEKGSLKWRIFSPKELSDEDEEKAMAFLKDIVVELSDPEAKGRCVQVKHSAAHSIAKLGVVRFLRENMLFKTSKFID